MISKILSFDWALFFFWIMATTLGWFVGGLILSPLSFVFSGFLVGIFQWWVLQGRIRNPWRWIVATTAGWTAGYLLTFFGIPAQFEFANGVMIGLTTGLAQWLVLFPGVMLTGMMAGILTGLALEILLRHPQPKGIGYQAPSPDHLGRSGGNAA